MASGGVVVGYLLAAPTVGKRASRSPCRRRHDLANHRSPRAHTPIPDDKTSMILMRSSLCTEVVGMSSLVAEITSRTPSRAMAGFPSPWIIGWDARFQAGLRDEDASAATPSEIGEAPRSEPGDGAHAALHAVGYDESALIGGTPSSRPAARHPRSPTLRSMPEAPCAPMANPLPIHALWPPIHGPRPPIPASDPCFPCPRVGDVQIARDRCLQRNGIRSVLDLIPGGGILGGEVNHAAGFDVCGRLDIGLPTQDSERRHEPTNGGLCLLGYPTQQS